jgi:hypothetical protein
MGAEDELVDLEQSGWRVLSTSGEATEIFYSHVLDQSPVMLLPGGTTLTDRNGRWRLFFHQQTPR